MTAMDAARAVLPVWVTWGAVPVWMALAFLACWGATWLAAALPLRALRGAGQAHWTERARRALPARVVGRISVAAVPLALASVLAERLRPAVLALPATGFLACVLLAGLVGALLGDRGIEQRVRREPVPLGRHVGGAVVTVLLFLPHLLLAAVLLFLTSRPDAPASLLLWGAGVAGLLALCAGGVLPLLRGVGVLRPASPRLLACVRAATASTGVHPRRVVEARWLPPNAVAFPILRWVVVPERTLALLSDEELTAVCAHELSHLSEPVSVTLVRVLAAAGLALPIACMGLLAEAVGPLAPLLAAGVMLLVPLLSRRLLQRMEERADAAGHAAEGAPAVYARALERIYEANLLPAALSSSTRSPHPALYDRMLAAGVEPSFPRPAPPASGMQWVGFGVLLVAVLGAAFAGMVLSAVLVARGEGDEPATLLALAAGGEDGPLAALATLREGEGRTAEAVALYAAAAELDSRCAHHPAQLAHLLARTGECGRAHAVFEDAVERNARYAEEAEELLELAWLALEDCDADEAAGTAAAPGP